MPEKKGLNLDILKEIIHIMEDNDLSEVSIEQNDIKIQVKRASSQPSAITQGAAVLTTTRAETERPSGVESTSDELVVYPAPMVGTFYRAPSSDTEPCVSVGDEIKAGQVICVIEAMKLMNEITADLDGEIVEILVEDGEPVEYNQPIFRIRPK